MKLEITFFLMVITRITCMSQQHGLATIYGEINIVPSNKIITIFHIKDNGSRTIDTSNISNGKFHFQWPIKHPTRFIIRGQINSYEYSDPNSIEIFLDPGKDYKIKLEHNNFKNIKIKNSESDKELREFNASSDKMKLIAQRPNSFVAAYFHKNEINNISFDSLILLYNSFTDNVKEGHDARQISKYIKKKIETNVGVTAKIFTKIGHNGTIVNPENYKGKYVLLDFWASWCKPCRAGNPRLVALYNAYHEKGLEIIGISDDDHLPDKWLEAIKKDGLIWNHILRGFSKEKPNNEADISKLYGVYILPTFILIEPNGKILYKLTGEESMDKLHEQLFEIFK